MKAIQCSLDTLLKLGTLLSTVGILLVVTMQAFARLCLPSAPALTEEAARFFFLFSVAFAAPLALRDQAFVRVDTLALSLPARVTRWLHLAIDLVIGLVMSIVSWASIGFVHLGVGQQSPCLKLPMIIAGTLTGLSVGKLFLAGALPGILLGLGFMVTSWIISQKRGHPKHPKQSIRQVLAALRKAAWALGMPVVILVGILGGFVTPTEASIGAVLYALVVGTVVYRSLTPRKIFQVIIRSAITTASLMVLVGFANVFSWILASEQIPQKIAQAMLNLTHNKILMLLLINGLLLFVGTFMETIAALIILFPVLLKVAVTVGVDPLQFAVIAVLNLVIGLTTPPVGVCLFVAAGIGKISLGRLSRAVLPFLAVSLLVLLLVTYVPAISLTLPQLLHAP